MSGNLESLKRGHAAFNRGNPEIAIALSTDDVDWGTTGAFPGMRESYRGAEAIRKWTETLRNAWTEFEVSLDEVIHDKDDVLVVVERLRGCGRESGAWVEMPIHTVYWFEDGKVRRREAFQGREEALAAALRGAPARPEEAGPAEAEAEEGLPTNGRR